ncbi:hypothetical protein GDO81_011321 [Engystomops pustulosus]|uniref:Uncharacterized protein n=1 Tax=Engystomops pustulosus TaxID=76066 RepID=A0AAV7BDA7_ENGPU|nr:hypothetical protein GDO81_011321 [Engystomops pustulosus]
MFTNTALDIPEIPGNSVLLAKILFLANVIPDTHSNELWIVAHILHQHKSESCIQKFGLVVYTAAHAASDWGLSVCVSAAMINVVTKYWSKT